MAKSKKNRLAVNLEILFPTPSVCRKCSTYGTWNHLELGLSVAPWHRRAGTKQRCRL